jgi:hypothetical protein
LVGIQAMTNENRLRELIKEVLDSARTPEEVCAECPELLPEVRKRLRQIRRVDRQLDALFPSSHAGSAGGETTPSEFVKLPQSDDPPRRYGGARHLADDLRRFLERKSGLARHVSGVERIAKWARRRPAAATLLVVLVVLLAAIVAASIWLRQQ